MLRKKKVILLHVFYMLTEHNGPILHASSEICLLSFIVLKTTMERDDLTSFVGIICCRAMATEGSSKTSGSPPKRQ